MKKVLITGASGFIGSFLVEEALKRGYEVYAGIRSSSSRQYLQDSRIKFISLDFKNKGNLIKTLEEFNKEHNGSFDYIIHCAGVTKANDIQEFYDINYEYTKNFVEALMETKSNVQKFIQLSSLASYGPGNAETLELINHSQIPHPVSGYGKSKLMTEEYLNTLKDFPYIIFRPTTIYGPREKELFTVFKMVNSGFEFYIGSTPQHLSFIYIDDFVTLCFDALESNIKQRSYFVCDGKTYLSSEFNNHIKKALNKKTLKLTLPVSVVRGLAFTLEKTFGLFGKTPALNSERVREFECTNWTIYTEDLFQDFNFKPQYFLERGVKETADWYKKEKWL